MVRDGIAEILPEARAAGVPLAIEPLHPMYAADRAVVSTLDQGLDLCAELGGGCGVVIDAYHVWWDPNLAAAIARAGREKRILAHHISDWLVPTRDLLLDRGMMGDGVIDLKGLRAMIEQAGYLGPQEVEIFSRDTWWKTSGDEVLATCLERFARCC
jgi:sugar phosphate isomerase/epimerase